MWLAQVLLVANLLLLLHLGTMVAACRAVGAQVTEVQIFYGPSLTLREANPRVSIGLFPFGGWLRSAGQGGADPGPGRFDDLPRWSRVLVLVSGNLALLAVAAIALGPAAALLSAARTPVQLLGFFDRHGAARGLVESLAALGDGPFAAALGPLAAKLGAFQLLPAATLNGGAMVRVLLPDLPDSLALAWNIGSMLAMLVLLVFVGLGIGSFFWAAR